MKSNSGIISVIKFRWISCSCQYLCKLRLTYSKLWHVLSIKSNKKRKYVIIFYICTMNTFYRCHQPVSKRSDSGKKEMVLETIVEKRKERKTSPQLSNYKPLISKFSNPNDFILLLSS